MTNPKTYYCAWHPEIREHDHILVTTEDRIWANLRWYYSTNTIEQVKTQGWQVKEVVIVEKYSEGKYGCIDDYLKECFPEIYKKKQEAGADRFADKLKEQDGE
jgi:hypothetical protein